MPPALAHSPRTGDGATDARAGGWDQAAPGATAHHRPAATARTVAAGAVLDGAVGAPPPFSAAGEAAWAGEAGAQRFGVRDAAHGVLLAVLAQAAAACLVLCVAAARLLGSGHDGLSLERGSTGPLFLAAGFGFATAAALIGFHAGFNRGRLRHTTIVIALTLAAAWPLSGFALPAALIATVAIGLAAAYDRFRAPTRAAPPIPAGILLTVVATGLMVSGLAAARTHDLHPRPTPTPAATPGGGEPLLGAPAADGTPSATPRAGIAGGGPAIPSVTPHAKAPAPTATPAVPTPDAKTPTAAAPAPATKTAAPTPTAAAPTPTSAAPTPAPQHGSPAPAGPEAPAAAAPATDPADVVTAYYRALDGRRFDQAWHSLSPAVQKAFGGFAHWKAGFASTLESRPEQIVAHAVAGGGFSIRHVLVARDKSACGNVEQRFDVTWRLAPTAAGGWSAASLHAAPVGRPACR